MDKYQKVRVLGKGSFGSAILIKRKSDGALFVVKEVSLLKMSKKERDEARHECTVLQQLHHPNIVRYIEQFENRNNLYIVMEYCDGGDLAGKVKESRGPMKESLVMYYFSQVCLAMEYLHSRHILHRDIKTMNVFLMKSGAVKLGDFGISTVLRNTMGMASTVCGTPYYFSPELCRNKPYNNKSDIWALGVLLYECATGGRHPFDGTTLKQLMQRISTGTYPPLSSQYSSEFRKMVDWCFQKDPHKRPSIKQTLALPIVRRSLEQLEENLMLATQCRVRLKDIIDFDTGTEPQSNQDRPQPKPASPAAPAPGLTPGQAAALAMAKEQQQQGQRQQGVAQHTPSPRSPGVTGAVVGPKPSAANRASNASPSSRQLQPQPQQGPQHYSPYHEQILKNLEKLREQKRGPSGGGAAPPPSVSPPTSPTASPAAAAQPHRATPSPATPSARPDSPAATPSPREPPRTAERGTDDRGGAAAAASPSPRSPQKDKAAMQDDMRRVDAIMAKYGHNVDDKAKETIHAYMRRKQEEYLRRQKEDNERRERRNELRQRELRRVLDRQRCIANGAESPTAHTPRADHRVADPVARGDAAARPASPSRGPAHVAGGPSAEEAVRPGPPSRPSPTTPRQSPRSAEAPAPSAGAPSRPRTPGKADGAMPAHLRQPLHHRAGFGRDPREKAGGGDGADRKAWRGSPAGGVMGAGMVKNPLHRPSAGAEAARPTARAQQAEQPRPQRKRVVHAANSPRPLSGAHRADGAAAPPRATPEPSTDREQPHGRPNNSPTSASNLAGVGGGAADKRNAPARSELVEARRAAAQELREKRERLQAIAALPPSADGPRNGDVSRELSPRKGGGDAPDRSPAARAWQAKDDLLVRRSQPLDAVAGGAAASPPPPPLPPDAVAGARGGRPQSPAQSPGGWMHGINPAPSLGLEVAGHHASPVPLTSPTRRRPGVGTLSPVAALPARTSDAANPKINGGALPVSPSSRSPQSSNLRSPASRRHKTAAGADKRRAGALPPVSGETPELVDVQYGVAYRPSSRAGSAGSGAVNEPHSSSTDPLHMLRQKRSIAGGGAPPGGKALSPTDATGDAKNVDVPSVHLPVGGNDAASSPPYHPHRYHHPHRSSVGDAEMYAGMQRGIDTSAEEAEGFLGPHRRMAGGKAGDTDNSAMPSMLEALRSLREGDRSLEEELAVHKSGQLALLKQRQQQQQGQRTHEFHRQPSLPSRLSGEVDRFWEDPKSLPSHAANNATGSSPPRLASVSSPSPSSAPPAPGAASKGVARAAFAPPPPLQPIESSLLRNAEALPSPSGRNASATDGYAEMLQHLKDLLQRRQAGGARAAAGTGAASSQSPKDPAALSTSSESVGSRAHTSGDSPPTLHRTKARPAAALEAADGAEGTADSESLAVTSSAEGNADADRDDDEDFEDAVPLSPVRHTELNDTYTRMMAQLSGNDREDGEDEEEGEVEDAADNAGVYANDVFLNQGKAEVEEDGEEGYTGHYKLPSPRSLLSP